MCSQGYQNFTARYGLPRFRIVEQNHIMELWNGEESPTKWLKRDRLVPIGL